MLPKRAEKQCNCSGCDKPVLPGWWMIKVDGDIFHEHPACLATLQQEAPIMIAGGKHRAGSMIKHEGMKLIVVRTSKKQGRKVAYCKEYIPC